MADGTHIEWTQASWNPLRGCSKVSEGCRNCYAMQVAYRFSGEGMPYEGLATKRAGKPEWTNIVRTVPDMLDAPLHWKKPRRIFVNSMSDLFHPDVDRDFIEQVFRVMLSANHHTYQILTKRPERMAADVPIIMNRICGYHWVMPSFIWLGTSVENQATADERLPHLFRVPATVRWLSMEPLLAPVNLGLLGTLPKTICESYTMAYEMIHWVVVGGESGSGARPCSIEWIRSIVRQCKAASVPVFVKQLGAWACTDYYTDDLDLREAALEDDGLSRASTRVVWQPIPGGGFIAWDERDGQPRPGSLLELPLRSRKGGDVEEFPLDLQIREYPQEVAR